MWSLLFACTSAGPNAARAAWVQELLTADNHRWLARDPALVSAKYDKMEADPYDYLRGSNAVFFADLVQPDSSRPGSAFLTEPGAASVLLVGDAHIENLGTCLPGEEPDPTAADLDAPLSFEWVDLDASGHGPWTLDTRRATLSVALVARDVPECADCTEDVALALADGYADTIAALADGATWDTSLDRITDGAWIQRTRDAAREAGRTTEALDDLTEIAADASGIATRSLALDAALDEDGDGLLALGPADERRLEGLLAAWTAGRPDGFRRLGAGRRYGKGVASLPAIRYVVLWDRGSSGLDDDRLLELREVVDPPSVDGYVPGLGSLYEDNADRIEAVSHTLWSRPDADARMQGLDVGLSFKTLTLSGWFRTLDHTALPRWVELGVADRGDVMRFARFVGAALAASHARGTTLDGAPALPVIARDLRGGGADVLGEERSRDVLEDLDTLDLDHALFRALRAQGSPLLGAEALYP